MALEGMTDALRMEVAPFGVTVVLVEPGSFRTEIWDRGLASLPADVSSPYVRWYDAREDVRDFYESLPPPTAVGRAVRRALDSPRPRARYLVGPSTRRTVLLETLAPTTVSDYAKSVGLRLRPLPARLSRLLHAVTGRRPAGR